MLACLLIYYSLKKREKEWDTNGLKQLLWFYTTILLFFWHKWTKTENNNAHTYICTYHFVYVVCKCVYSKCCTLQTTNGGYWLLSTGTWHIPELRQHFWGAFVIMNSSEYTYTWMLAHNHTRPLCIVYAQAITQLHIRNEMKWNEMKNIYTHTFTWIKRSYTRSTKQQQPKKSIGTMMWSRMQKETEKVYHKQRSSLHVCVNRQAIRYSRTDRTRI